MSCASSPFTLARSNASRYISSRFERMSLRGRDMFSLGSFGLDDGRRPASSCSSCSGSRSSKISFRAAPNATLRGFSESGIRPMGLTSASYLENRVRHRRSQPMEHRFLDDFPLLQVLFHDPLEQRRSDVCVPNSVGVNHDDRSALTNAEAGSLAALDTGRAEEKP